MAAVVAPKFDLDLDMLYGTDGKPDRLQVCASGWRLELRVEAYQKPETRNTKPETPHGVASTDCTI